MRVVAPWLVACLAAGAHTAGSHSPAAAADVTLDWWYADFGGRGAESWPKHTTACGGERQSPIDIHEGVLARKHDGTAPRQRGLHFTYHATQGYSVVNTQMGLSVQVASHGTDLRDPNQPVKHTSGKQYRVKEVRLHTPAEHTVAGARAAMELQIVHEEVSKSEAGEAVLIVSVLYETSAAHNTALEALLRWHLPSTPDAGSHFYTQPGKTVTPKAREAVQHPLDLSDLLPPKLDYATYLGSRTAPPCTEDALYYVYTTPSFVSTQQLAHVATALNLPADLVHLKAAGFAPPAFYTHGNARPAQPLNERAVRYHMDQNDFAGSGRSESHYNVAVVGLIFSLGTFLASAVTAIVVCRS